MTIENTYFRFQDTAGGIDAYLKPDQVTIGEGETKDLTIQDAILTQIQLIKRTAELQFAGLNQATAEAIIARVDETKLNLINRIYTGFDIDFGAFQLSDARATTYTPVVAENINGVLLYVEGFNVTYSSGVFN